MNFYFFYKATIAAAKDTTEGVLRVIATVFYLSTNDSSIVVLNDDFSASINTLVSSVFGGMVSHYLSQLATTINVALNGSARDGQFGTLDAAQLPPIYIRDVRCAVQLVKSSHATSKDVTTLGMLQPIGLFIKLC